MITLFTCAAGGRGSAPKLRDTISKLVPAFAQMPATCTCNRPTIRSKLAYCVLEREELFIHGSDAPFFDVDLDHCCPRRRRSLTTVR